MFCALQTLQPRGCTTTRFLKLDPTCLVPVGKQHPLSMEAGTHSIALLCLAFSAHTVLHSIALALHCCAWLFLLFLCYTLLSFCLHRSLVHTDAYTILNNACTCLCDAQLLLQKQSLCHQVMHDALVLHFVDHSGLTAIPVHRVWGWGHWR